MSFGALNMKSVAELPLTAFAAVPWTGNSNVELPEIAAA